ncbi:FxsA family protein [Sulfuriroseicoccus oceanibius]|uniref:FxsA family protein n=1 Tax=Sulfuriroseicoccus oceanibius TaxID=2707525 RepID=A0A6B3LBX6_9BACT|nr:FxsA family protein [Sulfuriroseicoccus oceanibius]QQL46152.1 FxsA family protein [Sulfuriroseicoccus oceanibius]
MRRTLEPTAFPMFARLLLLFISIPLIETVLFIKIGSRIGWDTTLLVILITGFLGAALTRRQGMRALSKFRQASAEGRLPANEAIDGLLILIAGAILLTPGFLTDAAGFALLVPGVRRIVRSTVGKSLAGKVKVVGGGMPGASPFPGGGSPFQQNVPSSDVPREGERVVKGKVIDVD